MNCLAFAGALLLAAAPASSPYSVQSRNFVVTAPSKELATEVIQQAEVLRTRIAQELLGDTLPDSIGPAHISVRTVEGQDVGRSWLGDRPERLSHNVWLHTSAERAVGATLAHELTHVVLATEYPGKLPAWAHEGLASREDDAERRARRAKILAWFVRQNSFYPLERILSRDSIAPEDERSYAMSASLVEFLAEQSDHRRVIAFALDGAKANYAAALKQHFGIDSTADLQTRWEAWLTGRLSDRTAAR